MTDLPAMILAGGRSSRMGGGDKCLLPLGGEAVLSHVIARLTPQAGVIALNANGDPARFADFGLPVVPDGVAGFPGPLAGILAAMDWAADHGADRVMTVAADTPFFPRDLCHRLTGAGAPLALAATPDPKRGIARHPTFGLWPTALAADLRSALADGVRRVVQWTGGHGAADVIFDVSSCEDPFFNVNTPQDLEQAQAILERAG